MTKGKAAREREDKNETGNSPQAYRFHQFIVLLGMYILKPTSIVKGDLTKHGFLSLKLMVSLYR